MPEAGASTIEVAQYLNGVDEFSPRRRTSRLHSMVEILDQYVRVTVFLATVLLIDRHQPEISLILHSSCSDWSGHPDAVSTGLVPDHSVTHVAVVA